MSDPISLLTPGRGGGDPQALKQLQRVDPEAVSVVFSARHVAIFTFRFEPSGKETWDKDKIEGALFVFRRKTEPRFALCVINRVGSGDFAELLKFGSSEFQYEFNRSFFMFRVHGNIKAIWLAEDETDLFRSTISTCEQEVLSTPPTSRFVSRPNKTDEMLTIDELRDSLLKLVTNDQFMQSLYSQYVLAEQRKRGQPSPPQVSPLQQPMMPGGFIPPPFSVTPRNPLHQPIPMQTFPPSPGVFPIMYGQPHQVPNLMQGQPPAPLYPPKHN